MKALVFAAALLAVLPAYAQEQQMKPPTPDGKKVPGAKDVVMRGEVAEHGGVKKYDMVLRWIDANTYVSEIVFHLPEGDLKVAETTYRRAR